MKPRTAGVLLKIIGIYQIIGGGVGLFSLVYGQIVNKLDVTIISFGVFIVFSFSIIAGIFLLKSYEEKAITYTLVNQYFQILTIKLIGIGYQYVAGSYFGIGFSETPKLNLFYKYAIIKSNLLIWPGTDNEITISINLIPILIIIIVSRIRKIL